ncbi:MAG: MBL fold metallo-hydrolase [Dehalococcoidia bacterium]
MQKTKVGSVQVIALVDNIQPYAATAVYPEAGDDLQQYSHYFDAEGRVALNFACFVCIDADTTLLVDTGFGPEYSGRLLDELAEAGVELASVKHILFTHLHGDHTGWNMDRATGKPLFPNATYLVPKGDWDHYRAQKPKPESFVRDVEPLQAMKRMDLVDGERSISWALTAVPTPGHTPGHTSVAISSGGERGFILGDVVISPVDAEDITLANAFDWDNAIARATREATVPRLVRENALVGASHLPAPGLGRFVSAEGRTGWQAIPASVQGG